VHAKAVKSFAGAAIGATVCVEALFAGPISGASMNPARSLGPALVSGVTDHLWIYLTATIIGALLALFAYRLMSE
jgi:aquaporin Z